MFQGFGEGIPNELTESALCTKQIKVTSPPERKYLIWVGGASPFSFSVARACTGTPPGQFHVIWYLCTESRTGEPCQWCFPGSRGSRRISPKSVPKDGGDVKEHDGSVSEELASFKDHYPVDDRAF